MQNGGEGGIRTLDGLLTHTPLAGERLRPLGHLSKDLRRVFSQNQSHLGSYFSSLFF